MKEPKEKSQPSIVKLRANKQLIAGAFNINLRKNQIIEAELNKEDLALEINDIVKLSASSDVNEQKKAFMLDAIICGTLSIVNI